EVEVDVGEVLDHRARKDRLARLDAEGDESVAGGFVRVAVRQQDVGETEFQSARIAQFPGEVVRGSPYDEGTWVEVGRQRVGDQHIERRVRAGILEADGVVDPL